MIFLKSVNIFVAVIVLCLAITAIDCKRGGGGRRGGSTRASSSIWGRKQGRDTYDRDSSRKSRNQDDPPKIPPPPPPPAKKIEAPKASAPSSDLIQREKMQVVGAQSAPGLGQRPVGWDVGRSGGYPNQPPPPYSPYPNTGSSAYYGTGNNYNYGSAYNPQQPFPGYYPTSNIGVVPPRGADAGHYYNSVSGLGHNPMFAQHNSQSGGGIFGSVFGGNKPNYGYGYGGYGGYGMGYGKPKGFGLGFGGNAFRNVAIGLLVWHVMSGMTRRSYHVHNYYNRPEDIPQQFSLPADVITLCPENSTSLCAPNTVALCTRNDTILCVASVSSAVPCADNSTYNCIPSSVPCEDNSSCNGTQSANATEPLNLPCIANATISGSIENAQLNASLLGSASSLCVTTVALPQPEEVSCDPQKNPQQCETQTMAAIPFLLNQNQSDPTQTENTTNNSTTQIDDP